MSVWRRELGQHRRVCFVQTLRVALLAVSSPLNNLRLSLSYLLLRYLSLSLSTATAGRGTGTPTPDVAATSLQSTTRCPGIQRQTGQSSTALLQRSRSVRAHLVVRSCSVDDRLQRQWLTLTLSFSHSHTEVLLRPRREARSGKVHPSPAYRRSGRV